MADMVSDTSTSSARGQSRGQGIAERAQPVTAANRVRDGVMQGTGTGRAWCMSHAEISAVAPSIRHED